MELFDKEEPPVWKSADGRTGFIFLDPTAALEAAKVAGGGELHMPEGEDEEAMRAHEALENGSTPSPSPSPSPTPTPSPTPHLDEEQGGGEDAALGDLLRGEEEKRLG